MFSSWPDYISVRPAGLTVNDHLSHYKAQLELAKLLNPIYINAQSGASLKLGPIRLGYKGTIQIDAELGKIGLVRHETHRNRSLFNPYVTDYVLERVPELRLTDDLSHWVLGCERLLQSPEDVELLAHVIPHIHHVHARIGTTQSSQCSEPINPVFAEEKAFFASVWTEIIDTRLQSQDHEAFNFVPEYGPFPYDAFNAAKAYGQVTDEGGVRLTEALEKRTFD